MHSLLPRRSFLAATSAGGGLFGLAACRAAEPLRPEIVAFSKPFIDRSFEETADLVADVGWDGIECPVRDGTSTHVAPSRVEEDLPKMVEALRRRGKSVAIVTTSVVGLDAAGEKVLRTAAALGIRCARLGFMKYPRDEHPTKGVAELRARLADVVALARETGIRLGYQNHSGADYVGAPIWDVWEAIKEYDPAQIGTCFDVGHAAIEGGLSWPVQARLMADRLTAVYCKDFFWNRTAKGQELRWCPLGDGVTPRAFFGWLRTTGFSGPISQHHEYDLGTGPEMIAHFKRDLETLRGWLAA